MRLTFQTLAVLGFWSGFWRTGSLDVQEQNGSTHTCWMGVRAIRLPQVPHDPTWSQIGWIGAGKGLVPALIAEVSKQSFRNRRGNLQRRKALVPRRSRKEENGEEEDNEVDGDEEKEARGKNRHKEKESSSEEEESADWPEDGEDKAPIKAKGKHGNYSDGPSGSSNEDQEPDKAEGAATASSKQPAPPSTHGSKGSSHSESCDALSQFYTDMGGPQWKVATGWSNSSKGEGEGSMASCCNWFGVQCRGKSVIAIDLPNNNLVGSLSTELFKVKSLERLNASSNSISGVLPDQFDSLLALQSLVLESNSLSGALPTTLSSSTALTTIHLSNNSFTGAADFGKAGSLVNLLIGRNAFTSFLVNPQSPLQRLMINDNQLSGALPEYLRDMSSLKTLNFARNQYNSSLFDFSNMQNLTAFDARSNRLTGPFPTALAQLANLQRFDISGNSISGTFPSSPAPPALKTCKMLPNLTQLCPPIQVVKDPMSLANRCRVSCAPTKPGGSSEQEAGSSSAGPSIYATGTGVAGGQAPSAQANPGSIGNGLPIQRQQPANPPTMVPFDYSYLDPATDPSLRRYVNNGVRRSRLAACSAIKSTAILFSPTVFTMLALNIF